MAFRVEHEPADGRFVAYAGDELAGFTEYSVADDVMVLPHTLTRPAYGGKGVASAVVHAALEHARDEGLRVDPQCWYVAGWIERHPDYADLVA